MARFITCLLQARINTEHAPEAAWDRRRKATIPEGRKTSMSIINLFRRKNPAYRAPGCPLLYDLYDDMADEAHLLIAGKTGSGKSVVENGIIYNLLHKTPDQVQLILIDPKKVELSQYRNVPHCLVYADEQETMIEALQYAVKLTEQRYSEMQLCNERKYWGSHVYIMIDELADLMTTCKKQVQPLIQRLCQIGRAARIHVIACTQCPLATVIPTAIGVNFDARVGLRTRNAQDSRNIIGVKGCEDLPRFGQGYFLNPDGMTLYNIPMYSDYDIDNLIDYWTSKRCMM